MLDRTNRCRYWSRSCGHCVTPIEIAVIFPDAVHDHGQLAGNRQLGATHADAGGKAKSPRLELRWLWMANKQDVHCLEQVGAEQSVTTLRYMTGLIDLAGLIASRRQTEIGPD
jgi:hypothetical protein